MREFNESENVFKVGDRVKVRSTKYKGTVTDNDCLSTIVKMDNNNDCLSRFLPRHLKPLRIKYYAGQIIVMDGESEYESLVFFKLESSKRDKSEHKYMDKLAGSWYGNNGEPVEDEEGSYMFGDKKVYYNGVMETSKEVYETMRHF